MNIVAAKKAREKNTKRRRGDLAKLPSLKEKK